jgi:small-conductance mechanosensitive channel
MSEGDISQISVGEFETVSQLLASSESLQLAFIIMIVGIVMIAVVYRTFSSLIKSKKIFYIRPHLSRFIQNAVLPFFAIALISTTNVYIQTSELFEQDSSISTMEVTPEETFAKILNTFNILVIGYTISHLIPIILTKRDKSILEKQDFETWYGKQGYEDDEEDDFFSELYKWIPPTVKPEEYDEDDWLDCLKTVTGLSSLEQFRTSKGHPIGSYEKLVSNTFEKWKEHERGKYLKYFNNCITGNNQTGRKLKLGANPEEIFAIDIWREERRMNGYEPLSSGSRPAGYARKKREGIPKSFKQILPVGIFIGTILGIVAWWGVDLFVLATATGGLAIGIGLALQETMQNYFAYIMIRKDNIFKEGERIQLESGYNGYVLKITPRVTYVRDGLHESVAIIPTRQLVTAQIINYTKENKLVPAIVTVGVSYLNDPKQVAAILVKIGKRGMIEIQDSKGRHLVRQNRCPYLDDNFMSCGCDKDLHVDITQPIVRFNQFNDSALDFAMFVYVKDYGSQFKAKTDLRMIMYEEFKKYNIKIPWPIRTVYQGDEKKEQIEIDEKDKLRNKVIDDYGIGDIGRGEGDE